MNARGLCIGLAVAAIGLTACGGGSTSPVAPMAPATPAPATPTPYYPPHPSGAGDTFAFYGSLTENDSYTYPTPNPLPSTSTTAAVTQKITVSPTANPFGSGTAQDFNVVEADAYPTQTLSTTTDFYYQSTSSVFALLGYKATDDLQDQTLLQYTSPQVIDQLPETTGATWSNNPAATITEQYPDSESATRVVDAQGGYVDTEQMFATDNYPSVTATLSSNDDGSASFVLDFHEDGRANSPFPPNTDVFDSFILSAPQAQSPGGAQAIFYSYQQNMVTSTPAPPTPSASPSATATPTAESVFPVWYKLPLYSEHDTDKGVVDIPKSCQAPAAFGTSATQLEQSVSNTDTALGTIAVTTTDEYVVAGFGAVCVNVASTINRYYDYDSDMGVRIQGPSSIVYQGTQPMESSTISELVTLSSQNKDMQGKRTRLSLSPISAGEIANARIMVGRKVERDRVTHLRALIKRIYAATKGVGR